MLLKSTICGWSFVVTGLFGVVAWGAEPKVKEVPKEEPYQIVAKPAHRVTITIEEPVGAGIAAVMFPIPPDTESQRVVNAELTVETPQGNLKGARGADMGPLRKPLLGVALRGSIQGKAIVKLDVDFSSADLKPGKPEQRPSPLAPGERAAYLAPEWHYEFNTPGFTAWMKENNLVRGPKEKDIDFALRVLQFIQKNFDYKIHDGNYMDAKKAELATDDLGFICFEKSAECWGLSRVYTSVLRANGIPCRQVSGYMLRDGAERQGGHHLRGEVYLEGIGWVLAELAGATNNKKKDPFHFLGHGTDDMMIISRGINYKLPGPRGKGPGSIGTLSGFGMVTADGQWSFPKGTWDIKQREEEPEPMKSKK
jgi:hypothetical protein